LLVFSFLFATIAPVQAAKSDSPDNRYFIKSKASLWKNSLSVRNNFENGFTADLNDWQLRLIKLFGVEIEKVHKLYVSPEIAPDILSDNSDTSGKRPIRTTPDLQVPWGVGKMYGDSELASTSGGTDITVAVLDTGIARNHPDLTRRVSDCKDFTTPKPVVNGKCDDKNGHGTHIAGIIAADGGGDGKGIYGMAPETELFVYKVCDASGSCWADDIATAIQAAVDNGAQIINLSLGSDKESPFIHQAIDYAGDHDTLVVAAAGNDGPYDGSIDYPAANSRVISVGAMDDKGNVPDWSSRGANSDSTLGEHNENDLMFVAPGVNIESTWKEGYATLSGTSMATPHIVGLAALLWNSAVEHPALAAEEAIQALVQDIGAPGEDNDSGLGLPTLK